MNKERFKLIPSVFLLPVQGDGVLLSRRFQTGFADGQYSLVAGHLDGGESMYTAMIREAKEEVGIKVAEDDLGHVVTQHCWFGDHERVFLYFTVANWHGEIQNMEPHKCDDLSWFPIDDLPENTVPYIRATIKAYQKNETYNEFGWDK